PSHADGPQDQPLDKRVEGFDAKGQPVAHRHRANGTRHRHEPTRSRPSATVATGSPVDTTRPSMQITRAMYGSVRRKSVLSAWNASLMDSSARSSVTICTA